jgi:AcrR family transcriptional regulator
LHAERNTSSQRERLLAAIVHVNSERGYEQATIARVISHAGVSRATYYEHFSDKRDGFLAAVREIERRALATIGGEIAAQPPQNAAAAAVAALVAFAHEQPAPARLLMNETMAAGPTALDARDQGIRAIARLVEDAQRQAGAQDPVSAIPSEIVVGATYRLLASRLRRGERWTEDLGKDLLDWVAAHADAAGARRWRALAAIPAPAPSPLLGRAPLRAPPALGPGRPRRSAAARSENHRLRIIFATADVIRRDGYERASVAAFARAAGVDTGAFYRLFRDKRDAFTAVHEFVFQGAMAVTAGAFFAIEGWPQRIWEAARTLTQYLQQNPTLTYFSLIEGHAGGDASAQRFEELLAGFTIFLQEGYRYAPRGEDCQPSRVALEAATQAALEVLYRQARTSARPQLAGLTARLAFIGLAPFVGAAKAGELIERASERQS